LSFANRSVDIASIKITCIRINSNVAAGTFTGELIQLISNIRTNHGHDAVKLDDCGRFVLAGDLSDIADITHIDLSGIETLEGNSIDGSTNLFLCTCFTDQQIFADFSSVHVFFDFIGQINSLESSFVS